MHVPTIIVVVGASGAGKTTLVNALATSNPPRVECHGFDSIGVPSPEEMVAKHGSGEAWQAWALAQWIERLSRPRSDIDVVVLDAQVRPSAVRKEFERCGVLSGAVVLVDCGHAERHRRLRELRNQPELVSSQMDGWAAYLRGQADALELPIISSSENDVAAGAAILRGHVERLRPDRAGIAASTAA